MFVADTNVYLDAAGDAAFRARFTAFALAHGNPALSSVVAAEMGLGLRRGEQAAAVRALSTAGLVLTPEHADWLAAAAAVSQLERTGACSRSFWNDALLAAQCARLGLTLITSNRADFSRLRRELPVQFVAPFPA